MPSLTPSLSILIADPLFLTASTNMIVTEETAQTVQLQPAIAATLSRFVDADLAVAATYARSAALDVFPDGSTYLTPTMRVTVADEWHLTADVAVAVAATSAPTATLNISVSDAVPIVLEPDAPKSEPIVTAGDFVITQSNTIGSATDFLAAGVQTGDVLELLDGVNRGNYLIRGVEQNVLFVSEAFPKLLARPPLRGSIRNHDPETGRSFLGRKALRLEGDGCKGDRNQCQ